jgi:uncharacterized protein (DUF362 family)
VTRRFTRRRLWPALALAGCRTPPPSRARSVVAVLKAPDYSAGLAALLLDGARLCGWNVRGKRVLLKPNLVEYDRSTCVNTHVAVVAAAVELFHRLGAGQVRIGEGPGHRRDTLALAEEAGYFQAIPRFEDHFVDLNRDDVIERPGFLDGGTVYGWPKNPLHYAGIDTSIVELNRLIPHTLAIVDGIVGMEGNGPIQGAPRACGVLVMGSDVVAVDASCCRIMGIVPERVPYLERAAALGNLAASMIEQRGETLQDVRTRFRLMPGFDHLRAV